MICYQGGSEKTTANALSIGYHCQSLKQNSKSDTPDGHFSSNDLTDLLMDRSDSGSSTCKSERIATPASHTSLPL